jgi:exodeoxyribonuclease VII small subunit
MPKSKTTGKDQTLESRLERLDKLVEILGGGETSLEEARKLYEEGMGLVRDCRKELKGAKGLVEKLNRETGKLEALEPEEPE